MTNVIEFRFWSTFKLFDKSLLVHFHLFDLDQKHVIYFELKFEWTKSETACTSVTGPPNSELDQKLDPRVNSELSKRHTKYVFDSFEQV